MNSIKFFNKFKKQYATVKREGDPIIVNKPSNDLNDTISFEAIDYLSLRLDPKHATKWCIMECYRHICRGFYNSESSDCDDIKTAMWYYNYIKNDATMVKFASSVYADDFNIIREVLTGDMGLYW